MLRIVPLADEQAAYAIVRAAWAADTPDIPLGTFEAYRARLRHPWPGNQLEHYLAVRDGIPAGHLELSLPQLDNVANVVLELFVHPEQRRHGVGRALLAYAVERTRALGRRHLISPAADHAAAGFARAVGAAAGLAEIRSRLEIGQLQDAATADGYRTVQWSGLAPAGFLDDLAYLDSRLNLDAPVGDLELEAEKVDADRIRAAEEAVRVRRRTTFHTGAVHEAGGRLVAWTVITASDDLGWHGWQGITIVDPGHRGHGLGLTIKNQNLRYAVRNRPALRAIDTLNAAANTHMLRINQQMGFRRVDNWTQWQLTV